MDVFHSIQEFIVNYEINLDKNNSETIAIYNSIVTIMKTMIDADNGKHILDIISPNFDKIKENINKIKELPEVNLNYLAIDLLIFKSLIFIYYQMNKIPNFARTFIEDTIRFYNLPLYRQDHKDPFDRILISQALNRSLPLVTSDSKFNDYPIEKIWK